MVALLVVSTVQGRVVAEGSLEDPTWEPWPTGDIALPETEDEYTAAVAPRDRRAAANPFAQDVESSA